MTLSTTALGAPEPNTFLRVNDVFARNGSKKSAGYEDWVRKRVAH